MIKINKSQELQISVLRQYELLPVFQYASKVSSNPAISFRDNYRFVFPVWVSEEFRSEIRTTQKDKHYGGVMQHCVWSFTTEDGPEFSTVLEHALNVNHNDFWPIFLLLCTKALKNIIKDMKKNQTWSSCCVCLLIALKCCPALSSVRPDDSLELLRCRDSSWWAVERCFIALAEKRL